MRKKRVLSLLLSAVLVISGLPVTAFAANSGTAQASPYVADTWVATSGATKLTVKHIDDSTDNALSNVTEYYRVYGFKADAGEGIQYTLPANTLTAGATYRVKAYLRAVPSINQAFCGDASASADTDNKMSVRIKYNYSDLAGGRAHLSGEWAVYTRDFTYVGGKNVVTFERDWLASEDSVPFDVAAVSIYEIGAGGSETLVTAAGTYSKYSSATMLTVKKAESVFDRVVIPTKTETVTVSVKADDSVTAQQQQTVVDKSTLGHTVKLTGSDEVTLAPGKYTLTGAFRLGWVDHAKLVMNDNRCKIDQDNNTAALDVWVGEKKVATPTINPYTWTPVSYEFELTAATPMSQISFELGELASLDYKDLKVTQTTTNEYVDGAGNDANVVLAEDDSYISVTGRDHNEDRLIYNVAGLTKDTYTISFEARTRPYVQGSQTGSSPRRVRMWHGVAGGTERKTQVASVYLTSNWESFSYTIDNFEGAFLFEGSSSGNNYSPLEVKDFKITKNGTDYAVNADGLLANGSGWKTTNASTIKVSGTTYSTMEKIVSLTVTDGGDYMSVPANGSVTTIASQSTEVLPAGVYHISGDFRIAKIDYGLYNVTPTVAPADALSSILENDGNLKPLALTVNGQAGTPISDATINPENWTNVKFAVVVSENTTHNKIAFSLASNLGLDFKNIKIEDKTSLYDTTFEMADGQPITAVAAGTEPYISVTGRDHDNDWVLYSDTVGTYDATSYEMTFWARTKPYIEHDTNGAAPASFRMFAEGGYYGQLGGNIKLTSEWTKYTVTFNDTLPKSSGSSNTVNFAGNVYFRETGSGYSYAPIEIKDFKITAAGSSDNLAHNPNGVFANGAGWKLYSDGGSFKETAIAQKTDEAYLAIPKGLGMNTSFNYSNDDYLPVGIYHIVGDFILNEPIDYNKYSFDSSGLYADDNTATVTVSVQGNAPLKTLSGDPYVVINPENFTDAAFKLVVNQNNTVKYSDITFLINDADGAVAVGVKDYDVIDMSANYGGDWESNDHEQVENVTADNGEQFSRTEAHDSNTVLVYNGQDTLGEGLWFLSGKFRLGTTDTASAALTATLGGVIALDAYLGIDVDAKASSFTVTNGDWCEAKFLIDTTDPIFKSDVSLAIDAGYSLEFAELTFVPADAYYNDEIVDSEGDHPIRVDGSLGERYISVTGRASNEDAPIYKVAGLEAGTYTVSFKARTKPYIASPAPELGENPAKIRVSASRYGTAIGATGAITPEWAEYGPYTVNNFTGELYFRGTGSGYSFAPYDIKDLVITKPGESANLAVNADALLANGSGWSFTEAADGSLKKLDVSVSTDRVYDRVIAPSVGATEISFASEDTLVPGIYHIKGKFRVVNPGIIDFNLYEGTSSYLTYDGNAVTSRLTASAASSSIMTLEGGTGVQLGETFSEVTFVLDLSSEIAKSDIILALDGAYVLDISGLELVLIERHVETSDVNMGVLMMLLAIKNQRAEALGLDAPWNGLTAVDKVLDESTGLIGAEDGPNVNTYIRLSGRDHNEDRLVYENADETLTPGTYTISFWARSPKLDNAAAGFKSGRNPVTVARLFLANNSTILSTVATSRKGPSDPANLHQMMLGENWSFYSYTFKLDTEMDFKFIIRGNSSGYGVAPVDIDGFSVTAADAPDVNLAANANGLMNSAGAGWTVGNVDKAVLKLTAERLTESAYMTTGKGSDNTEITNSGATIQPGKYYITAKVRLSNIDYLKYDFLDGNALRADNNKAKLTATLAGKTLKTTDGNDSLTVTPEWATVSFVMDVEAATSMKNIKLALDSNASLDFDYINIDTQVNTLDEDAIVTDGELPPVIPNAVDLLDGAISEDRLAYWSYGDQTLEAVTDENGNTSFVASNITSNTLGFTYKPGFTIMPGTYKFTAQVRTTNEGERGMLRVMIGDLFASAPISNEWKTVNLKFEITDEMEFSLKMRGGPVSTSIQDYEFKNLSLVDANYVPSNVNLYANSNFNNSVGVLSEWKFAYGTGKLTVNTENGNSYLTVSDRGAPQDSDIPAAINLGFITTPGDSYTISYDIRTSVKGETMNGRTAVGLTANSLTALTFSEPANGRIDLNEITNTWEHVEHTFVATRTEEFTLWFRGGPRGEPDNKSFDIDNLVVKKVGAEELLPADGQLYRFGDFESDSNALIGWAMGYGTGKITRNVEDGNHYLTISDRGEPANSDYPVQLTTGYPAVVGKTYKVSFDIRTSVKGETMNARTVMVVGSKQTVLGSSETIGNSTLLYALTNEWKHMEQTFVADANGELKLQIKGGPRGEPDNKSFDIDNVKIEIVD